MENVAVFPVPDCACAMTSDPVIMSADVMQRRAKLPLYL